VRIPELVLVLPMLELGVEVDTSSEPQKPLMTSRARTRYSTISSAQISTPQQIQPGNRLPDKPYPFVVRRRPCAEENCERL